MRIVLVADTFPPHRNSAAVQLRDLSRELIRQGHILTVILPSQNQKLSWVIENIDNIQVLRLKAPLTKDVSYVRRAFAEFLMPFAMWRQFRKSPLRHKRWDGVLWYSPSIFHGPFINSLKIKSNSKAYLIIRDIFPEWAADIGLMGRGLMFHLFKAIAYYQYSVADIIGVQTGGNLPYFKRWKQKPGRSLEVLQNWLAKPLHKQCSLQIKDTPLNGRKVFVYAGNMGVAQGMDILLDLVEHFQNRKDIGFLFVGRGSEAHRLKSLSAGRQLKNILFQEEIHPDEIPDLYSQCSAGIVALHPGHNSHNIPGKFLTYMQCGLPVLANINAGNDLAKLIREEKVGQVCETNQLSDLVSCTELLLREISMTTEDISNRCVTLFQREFSVENKVRQIISAFNQ
jgi:glycosyltransferase involved in cell wall biosynthesis